MRTFLFFAWLCLTLTFSLQCTGPRETQGEISKYSATDTEWAAIDSLIDQGLYKTAQPLVRYILQKSISENHAGSAAKALRLSIEIDEMLSEDSTMELWPFLSEQVSRSQPPTSNVLAAAGAHHLWAYFQAHQWQLADRKSSTESADIREWPKQRFIDETARFYQIAFEDPARLYAMRWTEVSEILPTDTTKCVTDKTVLDLISAGAMEFYTSNEVNIQSPAQIIQPVDSLLAGNVAFIALDPLPNSDSYWDEAVKLLQMRTLLHQTNKKETALAELTIERLNAFKRQNVIENSDELYTVTLRRTKGELQSNEARAIISLALAQFYEQHGGQKVDSRGSAVGDYYTKAIQLCDEVLQLKNCPASLCLSCEALQSRIRAKGLSTTAEKFILPGEPWKSVVNYRNISECYSTVVSFDYEKYREITEIRDHREQIREITSTALMRGFGSRVELSDAGDFRPHTYEIAHAPLEKGFYVMITAPHGNLNFDSTNVSINPFWVTDISWMHRQDNDRQNEFRFVDRKTGKPLNDIQAQVIGHEYNNYRQKMDMIPGRSYSPDDKGLITVPHESMDRRFALRISRGEEEVWLDHTFYHSPPNRPREAYTHTHFFTDRKVYRPGQKVHFKGVAIRYDGEKRSVNAGLIETVFLYDVNSQEVDKLKLTTNEFGSYSGTFELPPGGLTGSYRIESGRGQQYINVEEYKRPTFTVEMNPIDSAFQLGNNVTSSGNASSLAGFPIKRAEVRYRVTRSLEQPMWWRFGGPQPGAEHEVAAGMTQTDEQGNFSLAFTAIQQQLLQPNQYYRFSIEVDVIDVSGETRSASQTIRMGERALVIGAEIPDVVSFDQLSNIPITATNLNGEPVHTSGKAALYRIEMPEKPLRSRLYGHPDQIQLDSLEFSSLFPNDVFRKEANIQSAPVRGMVVEHEFNTARGTSVDLGNDKSLETGWYELRLTSTDRNGKAVEFARRITLVNDKSANRVLPEFLWTHVNPKKAQPGEDVSVWVSSSETVTIWMEVEVAGRITTRQQIALDNELRKIDIPIKREYRGNFGVHFSTVFNNRVYTESHLIEVPYTNKKLDVQLITNRDLIKPGSDETWTFRVSSPVGQGVRSELLAGMYDASLDALGFENQWLLNPFSLRNISRGWQDGGSFAPTGGWQYQRDWFKITSYYQQDQCRIDFGGRQVYRNGIMYMEADAASMGEKANLSIEMMEESAKKEIPEPESQESGEIPLRSDFNETAFFIPQLKTDLDGKVTFEFTLPETLTTWKWMLLAHSKELEYGMNRGTVIAQKPLMVIPNAPRYFRQGDTLFYAAQVINKSDSPLNLNTKLVIKDLVSESDLSEQLITEAAEKELSLNVGESKVVKWRLVIPELDGVLSVELSAESEQFSDGERRPIPVLSRKMMVTESLPISLVGSQSKTLNWERLLESVKSDKKHHSLTLEFSANPAWYAVQALPYLMEYPYECSEQIFSRFYANALAGHIIASKPVIADMFRRYSESNPEALLSNLEKNQELKQLILEETPWLLNAQSESESKKRMALLFEIEEMSRSQKVAMNKLAQAQLPDGSWPWFKGMRSDRYITQYIVTGLGRLQKLGVAMDEFGQVSEMISKAIRYLDKEFISAARDTTYKESELLNPVNFQFLYMRSLFPNHPKSKELGAAIGRVWPLAGKTWTGLDVYSQAMLAVSATRLDHADLSDQIVASLNERSLLHEDHGRYWKIMTGAFWYHQKIETHTMLMELYRETGAEQDWIDEMKIWLLTQKKVQHWKTTTATANACYALLMDGTDWLEIKKWPEIEVGEYEVQYHEGPIGDNVVFVNPEPGTGYFKTTWKPEEITPQMGEISVTNHHSGPAWGAVYWQYFQNMDEVESADAMLKINRELFIADQQQGKTVYIPVSEKQPSPGDRVVVRLELESELDLEYVHLSDRRAAGLEPIDVRSGHQYRSGLGYYLSIKDAATHFFFDRLSKGKHVFEYELRANLSGNYSNGPGIIQCMYAPEYSAHTSGGRIVIE